MNKSKYIVGALLFDEDEQLFYRKVGLNNSEKTLIYTVLGGSGKRLFACMGMGKVI